jgi:hypothetical protein
MTDETFTYFFWLGSGKNSERNKILFDDSAFFSTNFAAIAAEIVVNIPMVDIQDFRDRIGRFAQLTKLLFEVDHSIAFAIEGKILIPLRLADCALEGILNISNDVRLRFRIDENTLFKSGLLSIQKGSEIEHVLFTTGANIYDLAI